MLLSARVSRPQCKAARGVPDPRLFRSKREARHSAHFREKLARQGELSFSFFLLFLLRLCFLQVYQQIRLHRGELESLLQGVVDLLLQCFRNFFGIYTLGISILLLPLCSSIKKHLDHVNRVPLNDPFLLR